MHATIAGPSFETAAVCLPILRALPAWFGIDAAVVQYAHEIDHLPTWLAADSAQVCGFVSIKQHTPYAAEIYVMGVLPDHHRTGIGRALLLQVQGWLQHQGVEYLQVKTLGPSHPDPNYAKTRAFYATMGFRPMEEIRQIWGDQNPCLIMIKKL
jgi:ribosomal protein S18 acetylase RimI-like enzyme